METTAVPSAMPPIFLTPEQKRILANLGNRLPEPWTVDRYATELIQRGGFIPVRDYLLELYRKMAGPFVTDKHQPSTEIRQRVERVIPKVAHRPEPVRELDPLQRWLLRHPTAVLSCATCSHPLNVGESYQITSKDDLTHESCEAP